MLQFKFFFGWKFLGRRLPYFLQPSFEWNRTAPLQYVLKQTKVTGLQLEYKALKKELRPLDE